MSWFCVILCFSSLCAYHKSISNGVLEIHISRKLIWLVPFFHWVFDWSSGINTWFGVRSKVHFSILVSLYSCKYFWFLAIEPLFFCLQLVKLLELREANHIEFCKIKSMLDQILQIHRNSELKEVLKLLMDPTWVATGLKIDFETLVSSTYILVWEVQPYSCIVHSGYADISFHMLTFIGL